jgi:hypothetical protein
LVISPKKEHPEVIAILNNQELRKKMSQNYFMTCYVAESEELSKVEGYKEGPQVIALRWNIF